MVFQNAPGSTVPQEFALAARANPDVIKEMAETPAETRELKKEALARQYVLIIDRSGSMAAPKLAGEKVKIILTVFKYTSDHSVPLWPSNRAPSTPLTFGNYEPVRAEDIGGIFDARTGVGKIAYDKAAEIAGLPERVEGGRPREGGNERGKPPPKDDDGTWVQPLPTGYRECKGYDGFKCWPQPQECFRLREPKRCKRCCITWTSIKQKRDRAVKWGPAVAAAQSVIDNASALRSARQVALQRAGPPALPDPEPPRFPKRTNVGLSWAQSRLAAVRRGLWSAEFAMPNPQLYGGAFIEFVANVSVVLTILQNDCYWCGVAPAPETCHNLDRIQCYTVLPDGTLQELPYKIGNICASCGVCNLVKGRKTPKELYVWVCNVLDNVSRPESPLHPASPQLPLPARRHAIPFRKDWEVPPSDKELNLLPQVTYRSVAAGACSYCGSFSPGQGIDRKNSTRPYTDVGNLLPCCPICNAGKADIPVQVWLGHLAHIREHLAPRFGPPEHLRAYVDGLPIMYLGFTAEPVKCWSGDPDGPAHKLVFFSPRKAAELIMGRRPTGPDSDVIRDAAKAGGVLYGHTWAQATHQELREQRLEWDTTLQLLNKLAEGCSRSILSTRKRAT